MRRHFHLVGIGGAGLSALAHVLHGQGEIVSGSDRMRSPYARALEDKGVEVSIGHDASNLKGVDLVISSSAIPADNVELLAAADLGIPVVHRREFLDQLTREYKTIAVAGTHGKTTTTGMIAWILEQAGLDPSFVVGGLLPDFGANGKAGAGSYFVIEADEYDHAFLGLHPHLAVVTNVEHDHPDMFPTFEAVTEAFQAFLDQVSKCVIICVDNPGADSLSTGGLEKITYGFDPSATWRAEDIRANAAGGMDFLVLKGEDLLGLVRTRLPGEHNVSNTLAALAACDALEVPFAISREAMTKFHGAGQRFEIIGVVNDISIVDDYAHHPTEIRATLSTSRLRFPKGEIWTVFQPHTYSRIRALMAAYRGAFQDADHVIITEVFGAREVQNGTITGAYIATQIEHPDVQFMSDFKQIAEYLAQKVQRGDAVVTLSAGDANEVGRLLLKKLTGR
jgi:UDP-N-acetylmuramate--alanine ligase